MSKALSELLAQVEAGEWDFRADAPARQVFPYQSASAHDLGLTARAAFEGSLDAAKALHEALLTGWRVACIREGDKEDMAHHDCEEGDWFVNLFSEDYDAVSWTAGEQTKTDVLSGQQADAWSATPARAWLCAILSALIAEGE